MSATLEPRPIQARHAAGNRPIGSLSLDLDNKWSYLKTHGDAIWQSYPSYLDVLVPKVLQLLKDRGLTITFFIVGQDAVRPEHREVLRSIADAGHEIGNHSFLHEPWLHLYSEEQIADELARAHAVIETATGQKPIGFRGPGFSVSPTVLNVLARMGYRYDASTFPTFLGPLARAYYFATSKLTAEEKEQRRVLFGKLGEGFRPLRPYRWQTAHGLLTEIPVTTMPIFKAPFHLSYLIYLACYSPWLARTYLHWCLGLCRALGVQPSLLLHPLDFLGGDETSDLGYFPAMNLPGERKRELAGRFLDIFCRYFTPVTMTQHAESVPADRRLTPLSRF